MMNERRFKGWRCISALTAAVITVLGFCPASQPVAEAQEIPAGAQPVAVESGQVLPERKSPEVPASQLSSEERQALLERKLAIREQFAASEGSQSPGTEGGPPPGLATQVTDALEIQSHTPSNFLVGLNLLNPQGNGPGASILAEPAAANNASLVYATGNIQHAEWIDTSGSLAVGWQDVSFGIIGGPFFAPIPLGDTDVVIDDARRVFFHSQLYVDGTLSNGLVRIFVITNPTQADPISGTPQWDCFYDVAIIFGGLPDYPHLGLTKRNLWLGTNEIVFGLGQRARMYRFNIDQMADCGAVSFSVVQWPNSIEGQKIWVPVEGTNNSETMYWAHKVDATTMRLFFWDENSGAAFQLTRGISFTNFAAPDCRGGANNTNYIRPIDTSIAGFSQRGTKMTIRDGAGPAGGDHQGIAFYWQSGPMGGQPQGFIRAAVFRDAVGGFALVSQPDIWNPNFCFGFPVVTANKRGDVGISLVDGGRAGGGGFAVQGAVGVADEFTGGNGFFGTVFTVAAGTHNPASGRFGDYFTIHPHEPCEKWFSATSYAYFGGTGLANVNSRYVEFGREQSFRCYRSHNDQLPNLLGPF